MKSNFTIAIPNDSMISMPFACIYVPNFSVAAALRAEPELKTRAVAILEGKPPLEKIIAVNENAARLGIAPGMTKAQADSAPNSPCVNALRCRNPPRTPPCSTARNRSLPVWKTPHATRFCSISPAWNLFSDRCPKFPAPSSIAPPRSDSKPICHSFQSRCGPARRPRIFRRHRDSRRQRSRALRTVAGGSSVRRSTARRGKRSRTACSKLSIDGAFVTCVRWPHCRK